MLRASTHIPAMRGVSSKSSRTLAFVVALALAFASAALAVGWALRLLSAPQPVPADARLVGVLSADEAAQQAARLFGAAPATAASAAQAPSRFRLYGVIAGGDSGAALIGIDGKPPRAVAVDGEIAPGVVLRATGYKSVWIERDGTRQELKMDPQSAQPGLPDWTPQIPAIHAPQLAPPAIAPPRTTPGAD
jgi:general secretion pathway protein C